ncbi:shikimate dehydrogenase [Peptococcaceae bacterium CEB3]|nr:shikimate dehydrogenase [Peptococcaceae bacterium CEB3]
MSGGACLMETYYAVIGDPIDHSLSPLMHTAGYRALGLEAKYLRFRVSRDQLKDAALGLRSLGFAGWNVTIPHKEAIIPYLDELTPAAVAAGAVNTVKNAEGRLIGHNTDGEGFIRAIAESVSSWQGKTAAILGAGGAARGIALALKEKGVRLIILNRTPGKAEELVRLLRAGGGEACAEELAAGAWLSEADLVVQTTPVGLRGEPYPLSLQGIKKGTLVVDIIYKPWQTPFLREAQDLGCRTMNGLAMFLHQGALAWEFWRGEKAPLAAMWAALVEEKERMETSVEGKFPRENIALIGFMATGKSSVGRRLASALNWEFIDTDEEIEKVSGLSVAEMFQRHGETRFRSEETLVLRRLGRVRHCVIATGGGMVVNEENRRLLAERALIISLYAPLDKILERVGDRAQRPLLRGPRERLEALWQARQSVYGQADMIVDTGELDVDGVVREILKELPKRATDARQQGQMEPGGEEDGQAADP